MQLSRGAQAAGLPCLAARQTLRPTILPLTKRGGGIWWNDVFGVPPKTARGPRVVPIQLHRSGFSARVVFALVVRMPFKRVKRRRVCWTGLCVLSAVTARLFIHG